MDDASILIHSDHSVSFKAVWGGRHGSPQCCIDIAVQVNWLGEFVHGSDYR